MLSRMLRAHGSMVASKRHNVLGAYGYGVRCVMHEDMPYVGDLRPMSLLSMFTRGQFLRPISLKHFPQASAS